MMATARVELLHDDFVLGETTAWLVLDQSFTIVNTDDIVFRFPKKPKNATYRDGLVVRVAIGNGRFMSAYISPAVVVLSPQDELCIAKGDLKISLLGDSGSRPTDARAARGRAVLAVREVSRGSRRRRMGDNTAAVLALLIIVVFFGFILWLASR